MAENNDEILDILKACREALEDKKAIDLKILDVRGKSPITNFFILASANSEPHMKALAGALDSVLREKGVKNVGRDYASGSGWIVVDAFDFMAHIFQEEQRGVYKLEALWKDAEEVKF